VKEDPNSFFSQGSSIIVSGSAEIQEAKKIEQQRTSKTSKCDEYMEEVKLNTSTKSIRIKIESKNELNKILCE
jgi:hypothetical protein